jgi:aspartyl-tRNA(Asn)/glutamyl-tRNA(Gln) amidotransferase subunit A
MLGTFVLSRSGYDSFFAQAQKVRRLICDNFEQAFQHHDVLIIPTNASLRPQKISEIENAESPVNEWVSDLLTVSSSLAGLPSISVPIPNTESKEGFPISMQVVGRRFADQLVLDVAEKLSQIKM